jgi:AbrB family looped-hinge helix DNA binding protein
MPAEFRVRIGKVGNSLRIVIPKPAAEGLKWKEGTVLKLIVTDSEVIIRKDDIRKDDQK